MTLGQRLLADKRRIVVPLALLVAANVVLFAVVVFPLGRQVASAEKEAQAARQQLTAARLDFQRARATVTGKQQADAALQKFYRDVLPANQSLARKLTYTRLAQLADEANVRVEHGSNEVKHEKGSALSKLTTTYTLTGEYRDVQKFIYSLETTPEFIVLENVALSTGADQGQGRGLSVALDIATFFRSDDAGD